MNYITYLAHGNKGYIDECRFSLLKFLQVYNLHPPSNTGVLIYTDQPQAFEAFIPFFKAFQLKPINDALLKEWIGGTGYIHRVKTKMIQDVLLKQSSNVIFFDTDTYITEPIDDMWEDISDGIVYMHTSEGVIDRQKNDEFRKWDRFLETAKIQYGKETFVYSKNFQVWNSGVLGLSPAYAGVLDEVLLLIDNIHQQFPKHITEQVASSYCFQKKTKIKPASHKVAHYWNLKEFRQLLSTFFSKNLEESIPTLVKKVHYIDALAIQQHKISYKRLPFLQRFLKNLSGSAWRIGEYEKKF